MRRGTRKWRVCHFPVTRTRHNRLRSLERHSTDRFVPPRRAMARRRTRWFVSCVVCTGSFPRQNVKSRVEFPSLLSASSKGHCTGASRPRLRDASDPGGHGLAINRWRPGVFAKTRRSLGFPPVGIPVSVDTGWSPGGIGFVVYGLPSSCNLKGASHSAQSSRLDYRV